MPSVRPSLNYLVWKVHALYYIGVCVLSGYTFSTLTKKQHDFWKNVIGH